MKIHCPYHEDVNPSMEVYPDGHGFCFVCWKRHDLQSIQDIPAKKPKKPEDLKAAIDKIKKLPKKEIRGLQLHYNEKGYFILWPDDRYYKFRSFSGEPRYLAPRGHEQPLLVIDLYGSRDTLCIVEGEINALSLVKNFMLSGLTGRGSCVVASPGPAGNFISLLPELNQLAEDFDEVRLYLDNDTAGIKALWSCYPELSKIYKCTYTLLDEDFNEMLVKSRGGSYAT